MKVDSHQHFWKYSAAEYGWISSDMEILRQDFLPKDLESRLGVAGVDGSVAVQAQQTLRETEWLLSLASAEDCILGVVGWVPLAERPMEALEVFSGNDWLKGIRHVVQDEPNEDFILGRAFNEGVSLLRETNLVYDILIYAKQLPQSIEFVDRHPGQRFVLDHIAKPVISGGRPDEAWTQQIQEMARREEVTCKWSGVVTEVRDGEISADRLRPWWDVVLDAFGPQRLLFGSDWPVSRLKLEYGDWVEMTGVLSGGFSESEAEAFWRGNARKVYQLD
ncbi:MAG: amidohydrolase family protein [Verrucomicrobiota bacterium]